MTTSPTSGATVTVFESNGDEKGVTIVPAVTLNADRLALLEGAVRVTVMKYDFSVAFGAVTLISISVVDGPGGREMGFVLGASLTKSPTLALASWGVALTVTLSTLLSTSSS
jgi:hypothetical protein